MSRPSYTLSLKRDVGTFQVVTTRYWPEGPNIKTQLEVWNGELLAKDAILLGSSVSRHRLLKDAGRRHAIADGERLALDGALARLGSAVEADFTARQRAKDPASAGDDGDAGDDASASSFFSEDEEEPKSQAVLLMQLAASWTMFRTPDGEAFTTFAGATGPRETHKLTAKAVKQRLAHLLYTQYGLVARSQSLTDALAALSGSTRSRTYVVVTIGHVYHI